MTIGRIQNNRGLTTERHNKDYFMLKPLLASLVAVGISAFIAIAGSNNSLSYAGIPLFMLCASVAFVLHWLGCRDGNDSRNATCFSHGT